MKAIPRSYGTIEIIPENDAERVWLGGFLAMIEESHRPFLSHYITVDLDKDCKLENGKGAIDMPIEDVIDKEGNGTWGLVDKIEISASGEYIGEELQRRIELLKGNHYEKLT